MDMRWENIFWISNLVYTWLWTRTMSHLTSRYPSCKFLLLRQLAVDWPSALPQVKQKSKMVKYENATDVSSWGAGSAICHVRVPECLQVQICLLAPPPPWPEISLLRNVRSYVNPYSSNSLHRDINTYGEYVGIKQLLPTFIDFLKSALIQLRCIQCMTLDTPTFMDLFKSALIYLRCIQCHTLHNALF